MANRNFINTRKQLFRALMLQIDATHVSTARLIFAVATARTTRLLADAA